MSNTASSPDDASPGSVSFYRVPIEPWKRLTAIIGVVVGVVAVSNTLVRCGSEQYKEASDDGGKRALEIARIVTVEGRVSTSEHVNVLQDAALVKLEQADKQSLQEREYIKQNLTESTRALTESVRLQRSEMNQAIDRVADKIDKIADRVGVPQPTK